MIKIFKKFDHGAWSEKVNFVDDNNVLLGYDMAQSCCENADWFVADGLLPELNYDPEDYCKPSSLPDYNFDTSFFKTVTSDQCPELEAGGMVVFRATDGVHFKYIHLFNCHNGYYSHGFNFEADGTQIETGSL